MKTLMSDSSQDGARIVSFTKPVPPWGAGPKPPPAHIHVIDDLERNKFVGSSVYSYAVVGTLDEGVGGYVQPRL